MNRNITILLLLIVFICQTASAQTNRKIRSLQAERTALQKEITQSENILVTMKKDVKSQLSDLALISNQISRQQQLLKKMENDLNTLNQEIVNVENQLTTLENEVKDKKTRYEKAMKYAYRKNRGIQDKMMFVLSAHTMSQMYRRLRYVREYSTYLQVQAEQIEQQQKEVQRKRSELLAVKGEKSSLLKQQEKEKEKLETKEGQQKKLVNELQRKQKTVQQEIAKKKKRNESLNAQIDRLIEQEIAAAKKREEERLKKERARKEAERKKQEAAARAKKSNATSSTSTTSRTSTKNNTSADAATPIKRNTPAERMDVYDANSTRKLASSFEKNKGSLPMPISGAYTIVSHYGSHNVSGLKNVSLDNKGIDIRGQAGASARAIFDGEVSAIFSYGGSQGVLVRHGNYISVYVNLTSVSVRQGQQVKTGSTLGKVANSGEDGYVLHFQLRHEKNKLNPESWLRR